MYELTCPSCRHTIRLSFVRPGAVAACAGCGRPFPVKNDYYRRVAPASEAGGDGSDALLPAVNTAAARPAPVAQASAAPPGNGAGAATIADNAPTLAPTVGGAKPGGSRPMLPPVTPASPSKSAPALPAVTPGGSPTPPASPGVRPAQPSPRAAPGTPGAPSPASKATPTAPRSRSRAVLLALLGALMLLTIAVAVVSFAMMHEPAPAPKPEPARPVNAPPDAPVAKPPVPGPALSAEPNIPLGRPESIAPATWSSADAGKKYAAPAKADKSVRVEELKPMTADRSLVYVARLNVVGPEFYEYATVEFTAIDKAGAVLGAASVKVPMLSGRQSQAEATIPDAVRAKIDRVECAVTPGPVVRQPTQFDDVLVEKLSGSSTPGMKLLTYNPIDRPLRRSLFLVRGFDDRGALVGQWVVSHEKQIPPAGRVELAIILPRETIAGISAWTAIGVGVIEPPAGP